jgi:hypothetical protein
VSKRKLSQKRGFTLNWCSQCSQDVAQSVYAQAQLHGGSAGLDLSDGSDVRLDGMQLGCARVHGFLEVAQQTELLAVEVEQLRWLHVGTRQPQRKKAGVFQQAQ